LALRTGAQNPLDLEDIGSSSTPTFGDLDGDGDLDRASSSLSAPFTVHYFPEPARIPVLGAALASLGWLRRRRRSDQS